MPGVTLLELYLPAVLDLSGLRDLASRLADLPERGVVVVRGAQDVFCRGLDLASLHGLSAAEVDVALGDFVTCLRRLRTAHLPCVAVVAGPAAGGGVGLAAACDVVVATESSTFALPEVLYGLYPAIVLAVLGERMSAQQARRMALYGDSIDADQARAVGLVDHVVPAQRLDAVVTRETRRLSRVAPDGVAALKHHPPSCQRLEAALEVGRLETAKRLSDPTVRGRIRRFVDDGLAPWEAA